MTSDDTADILARRLPIYMQDRYSNDRLVVRAYRPSTMKVYIDHNDGRKEKMLVTVFAVRYANWRRIEPYAQPAVEFN